MPSPAQPHADVLIVGSGIAGMCAAAAAAPRPVWLLCPDLPERSSSSALAQGGLAAALGADDGADAHIADTLLAGAHSAHPDVVAQVVRAAAGAVGFLESIGVAFDRVRGHLSLQREGGHRTARVLHVAGDRSGAGIVAALWAHLSRLPSVRMLPGWRALALLGAPGERVNGVRVQDPLGRQLSLRAQHVVLATGGLGGLFAQTTNGAWATGDGLAMALEFAVPSAGLEFVQFHPTALNVPVDPLPLLTEALRGAGARLITPQGRSVMAGRHPLADLAPRDIVSRAVFECAAAGEPVLLDATALRAEDWQRRFPGARATAQRHGLDITAAAVAVSVAAHYHMGGIAVDAEGRSAVRGLWACGEVACTGLHGANRLASNSLLEAVVYGRSVGGALRGGAPPGGGLSPWRAQRARELAVQDERNRRAQMAVLRERMSRCMGPVRDAPGLRAGIDATLAQQRSLAGSDHVLAQRLALTLAMLQAALRREESRGAHWRRDFPQRDARRDGPQALRDVAAA